jgi:hypothetical protein
MLTTTLRVAALAAVLAMPEGSTTHATAQSRSAAGRVLAGAAPTCTTTIVSQQRVVLADGQVVHVAAGAVAAQGREILIAGVPTYTWAPGAASTAAPRTSDSLVGVVMSGTHAIRGIPNPVPGRVLTSAKATGAGRGTWHVMLTERLTPRDGHEQPTDSARLWYGLFDGRGWSNVAPVGTIHGTYTAGDYTSDLVAGDNGDPAFAYALDARVGATTVGGVVLIRRHAGRWSFDTLPGLTEPRYARLLRAPGSSSWTLLYVAPFFDNQQLVNASLHAVVWNGRWSAPKVLARAGERALIDPRPFMLDAGMLVTWSRRAERTDSGSGPRIEWLLASPGGTRPASRRGAVMVGSNDFAAVALGTDSVMWFARDGLTANRIRVATLARQVVTQLGGLAIPNETRLLAVPLRDIGVALITSELGRRPTEPPAASILTVVKPVCPGG